MEGRGAENLSQHCLSVPRLSVSMFGFGIGRSPGNSGGAAHQSKRGRREGRQLAGPRTAPKAFAHRR